MDWRYASLSFTLLLVGCGHTHLTYRLSEAPADYRGELWRFRSPSAGQEAAAFSPDGRFILLRGAYACRVLETETGRVLSTFENAAELRQPLDYVFGAIGIVPLTIQYLWWMASEGSGENIERDESLEIVQTDEPLTKPGEMQQPLLTWADDSKRAYFMHYSTALKTIVTETSWAASSAQDIPLGPTESVIDISPNGRVLAISQYDAATVELSDRSRSWRISFPPFSRVSFAASVEMASVAEPNGMVHIIDLSNRMELETHEFEPDLRAWIGDDGKLLLVAQHDSGVRPLQDTSVKLVEISTGQELAWLDPRVLGIRGYLKDWSATSMRGLFYDFPIKANGRHPIEAVVVDLQTCDEIYRHKLEQHPMVEFSPDGRLLLVGHGPWHVQLLQVASAR